MSQDFFTDIDENNDGGIDLANMLDAASHAIRSGHMGVSRPAYAIPGTRWVKVTDISDLTIGLWEAKQFDGVQDITLFTIDPINHKIIFGGNNQISSYTVGRTDNLADVLEIFRSVNSTSSLSSIFTQYNDVNETVTFGRIAVSSTNVADGAESAKYSIDLIDGGTLREVLSLSDKGVLKLLSMAGVDNSQVIVNSAGELKRISINYLPDTQYFKNTFILNSGSLYFVNEDFVSDLVDFNLDLPKLTFISKDFTSIIDSHVNGHDPHTKYDTKASLETWAATAANGYEAFAVDEKKRYQVIDGLLTPIGGGEGGLSYQSTWDASTNTPNLSSIPEKAIGQYWIVNQTGNTDLDGITAWGLNDWAIWNGTVFQKIDNSDLVTSVNSQTGDVVIDVGNASIRHYQDYEVVAPTDYWTASSATLSVETDAVEPLEGLRSAKMTQASALAGDKWVSDVLDVSKPEFHAGVLGFKFLSKTNAPNNSYRVELEYSEDGATWVPGPSLMLENGVNDCGLSFSLLSTQTKLRANAYPVVRDDSFILHMDKIRVDLNPMQLAQTTQISSAKWQGNTGSGDFSTTESNGFYRAKYTNLTVKGDGLRIDNAGNYTKFTANRKGVLHFNSYIQSNDASYYGALFKNNDELTEIRYSMAALAAGGNIVQNHSVELEANESVHTGWTGWQSTPDTYVEVVFVEQSNNVTFKGVNVSNTQERRLQSDKSTVGVMTDLTFTNLEVGKEYELKGVLSATVSSTSELTITVDNGATNITGAEINGSATNGHVTPLPIIKTFTAKDTTLTTSIASNPAGGHIYGNTTESRVSYLELTPVEPSIVQVPVTDLVENVYSARIENNGTTASTLSQNSKFIKNVERISEGQVRVDFADNFFSVTPSISFGEKNNRDVGLLDGIIDTTGFTAVNRNAGAVTDDDFSFTIQRQLSDYRVPQAVLTANVPLSSGQSDGTPYWTGGMLDSRRVMARTWRATGINITATTTIDSTLNANIEVIQIKETYKDDESGVWHNGYLSGIEAFHAYYDPSGSMVIERISRTLTDYSITLEYLE